MTWEDGAGSASTPGTTVPRTAQEAREPWIDTLRAVAIAGVVVVHSATAYVADFSDWYYAAELDATTVPSAVFGLAALLGGLVGLGPLFLVAGYFSARSLARRGPARFLRDRFVRLGLPVVAFVLVVNPLADLVGDLGDDPATVGEYLADTEFSVMWFVVVLLVCSLLYAAARALRPRPGRPRPPGVRAVLVATTAIAAATVALWPVSSPLDGHLMSLRPGAWPQGLALFALGVLAGESGTGGALDRRTRRRTGWLALVSLGGIVALTATAADPAATLHRMDWVGLLFAALYAVASVAFCVWCLDWARRTLTGRGRIRDLAGRASYATYLTHPVTLTALMVALAPLAGGAEVKFAVVSLLGVPACFVVGHLLTRLPGLRVAL